MACINWTPEQRQAATTLGGGVIVSAAAGSGKTAVLAQRVAHLVCDAPPAHLCGVDQLLILTFTDAAAAEMRSRIAEAIRQKVRERPRDARLHEQLALLDAAQISTIHAFCLWLVRRWFNEAGIDPNATVLDSDEATLLRAEVLDALCARLYASRGLPEDPLGVTVGSSSAADVGYDAGSDSQPQRGEPAEHAASGDSGGSVEEVGRAFAKLVDDYGLGDDRSVLSLILKLHEFTSSLPDRKGWLGEAVAAVTQRPEYTVASLASELRAELLLQAEHCDALVDDLETVGDVGRFHSDQIRAYAQRVRAWAGQLQCTPQSPPSTRDEARMESETPLPRANGTAPEARQGERGAGGDVSTTVGGPELDSVLARFERVRREIAEFKFTTKTGPRVRKDAHPSVRHAHDIASEHFREVKKRMFGERLRKRFGLFSVDELIANLTATGPYVSTIVEVLTLFEAAYASRKQRLGVLDFSDLERFAFDLLHCEDDLHKPSHIAQALHRRFAHVLVDEFQDVNPIQEAIIRLVSRESSSDLRDNLFIVGDVKQSIYRFRLAEPDIFMQRTLAARADAARAICISLQANFRSRPEILQAVNVLFRQVMRGSAGMMAYDSEAELRPGRAHETDAADLPVEIHLLERAVGPEEGEDDTAEPRVPNLRHPATWAPIEREAFLIGSRIREWMSTGAFMLNGRVLRYSDIVVLLRATKINAERMGAVLTSLGIPAYADVGGSLFAALEVRDVFAVLRLCDNFQQDIPLAAVLRSPIMGERLDDDDLVEIRAAYRDIPFHAAASEYIKHGGHTATRERLVTIVGRIRRLRQEMRCRPLADVLWRLFEQFGYLAYVSGLPNGRQRRANLLRLHELARRFGSFRTQGLHRFLYFAEALEDQERQVATAPVSGESEEVVRIMSIHQSKGLEFPVVFVAGLGTKFNLRDLEGRMIFDRRAKIGLRAVDVDRMIEYPTAAHALAAAEIERSTRAEELRVLYVAMTRARHKLVLVGSRRNVEECCSDPVQPLSGRCWTSGLSISTATTPLEWILPALAGAPPDEVGDTGEDGARQRVCDVHVHPREEIGSWRIAGQAGLGDGKLYQAVASCGPLPADEPLALDDPEVDRVVSRLDYVYPTLASASVRAVVAASEFKRTYDFTLSPEEREDVPRLEYPIVTTGRGYAGQRCDAAYRGVITHRVLQHLDFRTALDGGGVMRELRRMMDGGILTDEDLAAVDQAALEWFVGTPLAVAIRRAGERYRREFQFIAAESPAFFDPSVGPSRGDDVLVRGVVDGILPGADGIDVIDFKTDAVREEQLAERCAWYRPQMELYARAVSRLFRSDVRTCWLVFMSARRSVALPATGLT